MNESKQQNIKCLINCNIAKEGIDLRYLDTVIFNDDKYSFIQIIQNFGRIMRKIKDKVKSQVYLPAVEIDEKIQANNKSILAALEKKNQFKMIFKIIDSLKHCDYFLAEKIIFNKINVKFPQNPFP